MATTTSSTTNSALGVSRADHRQRPPLLTCGLASLLLVAMLLDAPSASSAAVFPRSQYGDGFPYFATPSGRIACEYGQYRRAPRGYRVTCTTYAGTVDGQDVWYVRPGGDARADVVLGNFPSEQLPRATYGITYRYHGIRCRLHRTRGITCRNRSDHGFRVSIQRQRTF
jgi:hypothetical protein